MQLLVSDKLSDVEEYLAQSTEPVIVDIETTSLAIGKGDIICIGFAPYDREDCLVWWPQSREDIGKLVLRKAVIHNSPFDERWLQSYGAKVRTVWDTMFMAHLLDENSRSGLKSLGQRLLGYDDWAEDNVGGLGAEFGQFMEDRDSIDPTRYAESKKRVSVYAGKDVVITRELMRWQRKYIKNNIKPGERPVWVMKNLMLPAVKPLGQMEKHRMPVRMSELAKARQVVEGRLTEIDKELDSQIPPKEEWPDFLAKATPKWGSTNWTRWWLYVYQGALCPARGKPTKAFPEGSPSLSQENLAKIDHPAARLLAERSTLYKTLTGFITPLQQRTVDGRVSTSFKLTGTVTGRLSSASPGDDNPGINSQQIPRDVQIRNLFGEKGQAWIEADYSQLELRVAAVLANEKTMLRLFEKDEDIHTYVAKKLVRTDNVTKEHRTLAKGVNFGFIYGMHSKHFANYIQEGYGIKITQVEAEAFRKEYFEMFSDLEPWYRRQRRTALQYGGVPNVFGRFRHLPKVYDENYWIAENAFRQAINAPVQSTGSDFMLISLASIARDLRLRKLGAKLITTVHDSVCLTAPYSNARKVARIIKETMEKADDGLKQNFHLKADVEISHYWGGKALATY